MKTSALLSLRTAAVIVALAAPAVSHLALEIGQGYGMALALAAIQALASGVVLRGMLPARRWAGPLVAAVLLAALGAGAAHDPATGLLAMAGTAHALLYGALLAAFGATLRPGHTALVTWFAANINPHFNARMVPYTRAVTWAWTLLFAAQLATSAILLATSSPRWQSVVTILHLYAVLALALAEALVRRWRWRREHSTGLLETIRGVRRLIRASAASAPSPARGRGPG